ncbi:MAG: hypothetical protein F4137_10425 [Acidobacteria bacterium]|nr:hypothetical protein [Acidobacteriota bacterium]
MSQIVTEIYDAFRAGGGSHAPATPGAGAIAGRDDLVTKLDLERAVSRLEGDLKLLKFGYGPLILGLLIKLAFFP